MKQQTLSKGLTRDRLIEEMEVINLTGRALVGKVPGLEDKFRMPHHVSDQDLLTAARLLATLDPTVALIRSTGMATLVVDKTVAAVTAIADRIVILVKGEVVFEGTPAALKANPELMHRHLGV